MTVELRDRRRPMRGRYFIQSPAGAAYLRVLDFGLALLGRSPAAPRPVRRILIGIGGHLGDAVLATSVLPPLAETFPDAMVGVVGPTWGLPAFDAHPRVQWRHFVDHWKHNRTIAGGIDRLRRSVATHRQALREIRAVGYDVAIDLYPFYPTMSVLFRRAGIPVRAGHESGGGGPAYTIALPWREDGAHITATHARVVAAVTGRPPSSLQYDLGPIPAAAVDQATRLLREHGVDGEYYVIHPGTGDPRKAWPTDHWAELAAALAARARVVVTGAGAAERAVATTLAARVPGLADFTGRTSLAELRVVLRGARAVVAADSVAGHLAAAEGTPLVTVMAGLADPRRWRPIGTAVAILSAPVPCAPCFIPQGCEGMNCVRDVRVGDVAAALHDLETR